MTRSLARITAVALAITALAAPTALARPDVTPAATHAQGARHAVSNQFAARPIVDRNAAAPSSAPVTVSVADHGIDWATIGIGIAGSLLAVGAIAGLAAHSRRAAHHRVAA
jgi:hypothetical protein